MKAWLELARISNLPTAWTNVLAGWLLAGGELQDHRLVWLLLGASLLYSGGMILNDAADAGWDREHRKERPIPRGDVSVGSAWGGGMMLLFLGGCLCTTFGCANARVTGALVIAILAYDLYHKPWKGAVLVMGLCRTLLYLTAGSAVKGTIELEWNSALYAAAIVMGLYIVGISLAARGETPGQKVTPLGWIGLLGLLSPCLAPMIAALTYSLIHEGLYIDVAAIILVRRVGDMLFGGFAVLAAVLICIVVFATKIMRSPPPSNIGRGVGLLLASIVVVDGMAIASVGGGIVGCIVALLAPLLRLWQRKIAAT